ncbi:MAG: adenylate/guanylate cyclase domain-containing protein, partial [Candidatus Riflebacteria bacterium]|nr:adenylate/guanylate cyclase domain-containing protein [Candidatus Riflebacteria bacterium]
MENNTAIIHRILTEKLNDSQIKAIVSDVKSNVSASYSDVLVCLLDQVSDLLDVSERLLDNLLQLLVEITSDIAEAERGTLFLLDRESNELFSRVFGGDATEEIRFPMEQGIAGAVLDSGETLVTTDAYANPLFNPEIDRQTGFQTRNLICIPVRIIQTGQIIGVLELINIKRLPLPAETMNTLERISANSALVLHNAQKFEQIQQSRESESHMLELTSVISSELQLKPLLEKLMEAVTMILNCDRATVFLHDTKQNQLWSQVALGMQDQEIRIPANRGIAGEVFSTGNTVNIADAYKDSRFNQEIDRRTGYRTRNILCMPLINKSGLSIGVTQVLNKNGGVFTRQDEKKLKSFSAQASIAIENAKLFNEVLNMNNYSESILRSLSNGVISINNMRRIEKCNGIAMRILGAEENQVIGKYADITFTGDNHWIVDSLRRVIARNDSDCFFDAEITNMQGRRVSINMSVVPLRDIDDQPMGALLILEDLSIEKRLKGTLARYMTKEIADQLMDSDAQLGGQMRELSILFSDIRNFTTISERLGPQETVVMLNEYFSTMVDTVFHHGGILDKFIGDAMLAVFGAPFSSGEDADRAVTTAIDMMKALKQFNALRMLKNQETINIGIGIATDNVLVGNIGSMKRMDYTVIGDGVNLASRLESATKFYHADILISEKTFEQLKYRYLTREVDLIRVKGKLTPVRVLQILDHHDRQSFPNIEEVIAYTHQGHELYRQQRWQEAMASFEAAIRLNRKDELAKMYVSRCHH